MKEIIIAIILFVISIGALVVSIRSFNERGFLFNNAWLYASKEERSSMNKKPHYRQSAIVFLLLGMIFLLNAVEVLLNTGWIFYVVIVIAVVTVIYAIYSSAKIETRNK